jgi:hypothetical protein
MGLVANNPATQVQIRPSVDKLMGALATCVERVQSGQADAAIVRWFGADAVAQKKQIAATIGRFKSNINLKRITVGFEVLAANPNYAKTRDAQGKVTIIEPKFIRSQGMNAAAYAATDANVSMSLGDLLSHAPAGDAPVELGEGFRSLPLLLPLTGGQVDASDYNQSQFETLVHELSHLLLGTTDVKFDDGTTAYGAEAAAELATFGSTHAFRNAENWGIFVEAVGIHKSS